MGGDTVPTVLQQRNVPEAMALPQHAGQTRLRRPLHGHDECSRRQVTGAVGACAGRRRFSPFALASQLPVPSTSPPPLRNELPGRRRPGARGYDHQQQSYGPLEMNSRPSFRVGVLYGTSQQIGERPSRRTN